MPEEKEMVQERTWSEFRETGLFLMVNQLLHIFGWALVFQVSSEDGEDIIRVFPARVKFRGFDPTNVVKAHRKLAKYMVDNAQELKKEADE